MSAFLRADAPRVLVLSRNYPNNVTDVLGLWVRSLTRHAARFCHVKVVAPVPYCPPLPGVPENYARFRRVGWRESDDGVECLHPRFILGPGYSTYTVEWRLYLAGIQATVDGMRRDFPFDLIHAHFTYPDGVVATKLAERYGVPVVITEHNLWTPWMADYPSVQRRAVAAAKKSGCFIAVSESVRRSVEHFAGPIPQTVVIPCAIDGAEFTLTPDARHVPNRILFVGATRPIKGVDILLHALRRLVDAGRQVTLMIVGEAFYSSYQREEARLRKLVVDLGLVDRVQFTGKQRPPELVRTMQSSAALVLPSRAESLGMVLIEALACGTPVVATRCGGPEEIVNDRVGVLVPIEDPGALACGIAQVLDRRSAFDPRELRAHAITNFGLDAIGRRLEEVYVDAVGPRAA